MKETQLPGGQRIVADRYLVTGEGQYRDMKMFMEAQESKRRREAQAAARKKRQEEKPE